MLQAVGTRISDLEASVRDGEKKIADDIDRGFSAQADLQAQIHSQAIFERDREHSRSRLLESLRYSQMHDRINSIEDHTESTFDWIFHPICEYAKGRTLWESGSSRQWQ